MTDKEMLEYAAKAAGIDSDRLKNRYDHWDKDHAPVLVGRAWNPLTDDGDALRLAVRLGISVSFDRLDQGIDERRVFAVYNRGVEFEHLGNDPLAATRRAIVRAAAEVGRKL